MKTQESLPTWLYEVIESAAEERPIIVFQAKDRPTIVILRLKDWQYVLDDEKALPIDMTELQRQFDEAGKDTRKHIRIADGEILNKRIG